jgi:hypothetical protein
MNVSGKAVMVLALAVAVLVFPIAAVADNTSSNTITWFNTDAATSVSASSGSLSITTAITRVTLANGDTLPQGSYGSITLSTGSLVSGSLASGCLASSGGCSFSFADSSFKISGSGGGPSWSGEVAPNTNVTLAGTCIRGTCTYDITAELSSSNGQPVGYTIMGFTTNGKFTGASVTTSRAGGLTNVTVPEPGTLGLLGVGLFCLAGVLRRKLIRS